MGFLDKLKNGLKKTKAAVFGQLDNVIKSFRKVDEELLEELEEILICSDVGADTTEYIIDELRERIKSGNIKQADDVRSALGEILRELVGEGEPLKLDTHPSVILVIGVNGVGKTTSIGKISANLKSQGKRVLVAAADTFRAAAIDQLAVWCDRAGVDLIRQNEGSDPAAVVYDAVAAAKKRDADVLIVDTAGRLHNKKNIWMSLRRSDVFLTASFPDAPKRLFSFLTPPQVRMLSFRRRNSKMQQRSQDLSLPSLTVPQRVALCSPSAVLSDFP